MQELINGSDFADGDGDAFLHVEKLRMNAIESLRMEHSDYHFAQDLAREVNVPMSNFSAKSVSKSSKQGNKELSPPRPTKGRKRKGDEPEGIAKFFIKKAKA